MNMISQEMDVCCDTGLALGLGMGGRSNTPSIDHRRQQEACSPLRSPMAPKLPSLTLSLSEDAPGEATPLKSEAMASPHSTVSSFSIACTPMIKVDKDVTSHGSCSENDGTFGKKLKLTKEQSVLLEDKFKKHSVLTHKQKHALAKQLNLRPRQVEVWFQNRRARTKLKQTEVDCEFLKRLCESLRDENRRLHKELQELKALKFSPPVCMPSPAATLTMCPSCKAIGGATGRSKGSGAELSLRTSP